MAGPVIGVRSVGSGARRDRGAAVMMVMVGAGLAAGIGLIAVLAAMRALGTEARVARQEVVDRLAVSAVEEAFGRLVLHSGGFEAVTDHPAHGPEGDAEPVAGPWVRVDDTGQLSGCHDARDPCYTLRSLTAVAGGDGAGGDPGGGDAGGDGPVTAAVIEATARQCRDASGDSCVWARRQLTVRERPFVQHVLWVGAADGATFVGSAALEPPVRDRVVGDIRVVSGGVMVCGSPELAVDSEEGTTFRIETGSATPVGLRDGCSDGAVVGTRVGGADELGLPQPDRDALETVAALGGRVIEADGTTVISFVDDGGVGRLAVDGSLEGFPANGVMFVDGDVEIAGGVPIGRALTVAATGRIEITGDVRVVRDDGDPGDRMIGLVSLGGNVEIPFAAGDAQGTRTIEALLMATACDDDGGGECSDAAGIVRATGDLDGCEAVPEPGEGPEEGESEEEHTGPAIPCVVAELSLFGAIVARELGPVADASTAGVVQRGFVKHYRHDPRLARMQPPYAVEQVRGRWLRVDSVAVAPLAPGLTGVPDGPEG